jgi:hypothetical protein
LTYYDKEGDVAASDIGHPTSDNRNPTGLLIGGRKLVVGNRKKEYPQFQEKGKSRTVPTCFTADIRQLTSDIRYPMSGKKSMVGNRKRMLTLAKKIFGDGRNFAKGGEYK